jgi:hypothetical protein
LLNGLLLPDCITGKTSGFTTPSPMTGDPS